MFVSELAHSNDEGSRHSKRWQDVQEPLDAASAWQGSLPPYAWAIASRVAITVLATPRVNFFDLANIVMLFLLGTVLVALKLTRDLSAALLHSQVAELGVPQYAGSRPGHLHLVRPVVALRAAEGADAGAWGYGLCRAPKKGRNLCFGASERNA